MDAMTFQTMGNDERVIHLPEDVHLPHGALEVTIRQIPDKDTGHSVAMANEHIRQNRVSLGYSTGIDNERIDADLARSYMEEIR